MTRQTWTALVSALTFVALAALLAVVGVPYVAWSPGGTHNTLGDVPVKAGEPGHGQPMIQISGTPTYPTTGELDLTTVSVTSAASRLSLPEALAAYWLPDRDTLPRDSVYPPGTSADDAQQRESQLMTGSQDNAIVAALREAGQPVIERPMITAVTIGAPAYGKLEPGDLILSIGDTTIKKVDDVGTAIRSYAVGDPVRFVVSRQGQGKTIVVNTAASGGQSGVPVVGITVGTGYSYEPDISFDLGEQIGGPSAGLVFALAIYDKITPGPLLDGRHVAATGSITATGTVGPIGGIQQKIAGAQRAGASVFLVPIDNCKDLAGIDTQLSLVKVETLDSAVTALGQIGALGPQAPGLPRC
ncbi:MAG TPA: S16 family serine protease [Microlunatus sp.]|nr:S16 family serine protease [Microlunatus sp.]